MSPRTSMPTVYVRIIEALQVPDCPLDQISQIVETDPALAAKLLQLVNSAFFGFAHEVASLTEAVQLLGVGIIRSLVLTVKFFSSQSTLPGPVTRGRGSTF